MKCRKLTFPIASCRFLFRRGANRPGANSVRCPRAGAIYFHTRVSTSQTPSATIAPIAAGIITSIGTASYKARPTDKNLREVSAPCEQHGGGYLYARTKYAAIATGGA